jgi:hypothetical protein
MPIELSEDRVLKIKGVVLPAVVADKQWTHAVVLFAPCGGNWTAVVEGLPYDGEKSYARGPNGEDLTIRIESQSLQEDMAKDPTLIPVVNTFIGLLNSITEKIAALREAERKELEQKEVTP